MKRGPCSSEPEPQRPLLLLDLVHPINQEQLKEQRRHLEQHRLCHNHGAHLADPMMHGRTTIHPHKVRRVLRHGQERPLLKRLHMHRLRQVHHQIHLRQVEMDGRLDWESTMAPGLRKLGLSTIESLRILSHLMARNKKHDDDWRNRVRDHFIGTNMHDREVFDLVEQSKLIITFKFLSETRVQTLPNINWT